MSTITLDLSSSPGGFGEGSWGEVGFGEPGPDDGIVSLESFSTPTISIRIIALAVGISSVESFDVPELHFLAARGVYGRVALEQAPSGRIFIEAVPTAELSTEP